MPVALMIESVDAIVLVMARPACNRAMTIKVGVAFPVSLKTRQAINAPRPPGFQAAFSCRFAEEESNGPGHERG
jgi:hypothetical protein